MTVKAIEDKVESLIQYCKDNITDISGDGAYLDNISYQRVRSYRLVEDTLRELLNWIRIEEDNED